MIIRIDYSQPGVRLDLWGGVGGTFSGIDRFGRVVDQRWQNGTAATPADIDRYAYGYDSANNRLWKQNSVGTALDEAYAYDPLNRLVRMQRGTLNGTKTAVTGTPVKKQDWTLDPLGNWSVYQTQINGTADLTQTRSHDRGNQIDGLTGTPAWAQPVYDAAGNTTGFPKPSSPASAYGATYDAWNRLTKITDGAATVATYQYDGQDRRVIKTTTAETRHFYYSDRWQDVEERTGSNTTADLQYVWGKRYFDELVCRDDASGNRLYACQDANFNLTAVTDASGTVQERYAFEPYGSRLVFAPAWTARTTSSYGWTIGHQGLMTNPESGLYSNRLRALHPTLGRFTSRDSIGYAAGANFYLYEDACPTKKVDPFGNAAADCCGPDVTDLLGKIATDVAKQFSVLSFTQKLRIAGQTTVPPQALQAWDIAQLFNSSANVKGCSSGTGKCVGTVTVSGQCYQQLAVNYWLAGVIASALESSIWTRDFVGVFYSLIVDNAFIKAYKDPFFQKIDWAKSGNRNNSAGVTPDPAYTQCAPCQASANHLDWTWRFLRGTVR